MSVLDIVNLVRAYVSRCVAVHLKCIVQPTGHINSEPLVPFTNKRLRDSVYPAGALRGSMAMNSIPPRR